MKKRTSVYIDPELLAKAKKNKLNLSQLLEKAIKEALKEVDLGDNRDLGSRPEGVRGFKSHPPHPFAKCIFNI